MGLRRKALGALVGSVAGAVALVAGPDAFASQDRLFGSVEYRGDYVTQWGPVLDRLRIDNDVFARCEARPEACPSTHILDWIAEFDALRGQDRLTRIEAVNRLVNTLPYKRDAANYGRPDYWATPLEFLGGAGDCEDFALFKFFALRRLGFGDDELRLVLVRENTPWVTHALLAVYLREGIFILDNRSDAVARHDRVAGYVPLYSANETARWAHYAPALPVGRAKGS